MAISKIDTSSLGTGSDTDAIELPSGTTAQRPTSPVAGMVRYNTTTTTVEYYDGTQWSVITSVGENFSIDAVIAAGAGGTAAAEGNSGANGGSGAGGLVEATGFAASINTNYTVTVGAGGAATDKFTVGNQGSNSVFNTFTAIGGGGGPDYNSDGGSGGSGAGGSENQTAAGSSTQTSPSGATGYGNAGGAGGPYQSGGGGGGGGAGSAGQAYNVGSRAGGSGKANIVTGTTLCAGGAGCPPNTYRNSTAGAANTGNGATGAGASGSEGSGASGGSGVIIIKYPDSYTISVGAGLTSSSSTSAGFTTTTFTAGTDSISFS